MKFRNVITAILIFLTSTLLYAQQQRPAAGGSGSWHLLGTVPAKHTADHDAIIVAGPYDYFCKLKFKVTNSPLNMQRMIVRYDDGGAPENIDLRFNIPEGGESRLIDIHGGRRKIKGVDFWYETKGFLNGRANLTLFGQN